MSGEPGELERLRAMHAALVALRARLADGDTEEVAVAERIDDVLALASPGTCLSCGHAFAGGTHDPDGKGCDVLVMREIETLPVQVIAERCGCMGAPP